MTEAAWGASGLAWLTGAQDGPPDFSRAAVLLRAGEAVDRLGLGVDAATLLAGRAGLRGWS
ncbi:MAG: CoA transferase, partial [Mycolicibacter sinensis]